MEVNALDKVNILVVHVHCRRCVDCVVAAVVTHPLFDSRLQVLLIDTIQ